MNLHPLENYLEFPGACYYRPWSEKWETFAERIEWIALEAARKREEYRQATGTYFERMARDLQRKISILKDAREIVDSDDAVSAAIGKHIDRLKTRQEYARLQPHFVRRSSYFEDTVFELIELFAENADLRFHELSPGAKESPSHLILFVADALASMNEHRSVATVWDRVNKAIKFARECEA